MQWRLRCGASFPVDERVVREWRAAEASCLFDALVGSGVEAVRALTSCARETAGFVEFSDDDEAMNVGVPL